jgi:hypothetical protein
VFFSLRKLLGIVFALRRLHWTCGPMRRLQVEVPDDRWPSAVQLALKGQGGCQQASAMQTFEASTDLRPLRWPSAVPLAGQ